MAVSCDSIPCRRGGRRRCRRYHSFGAPARRAGKLSVSTTTLELAGQKVGKPGLPLGALENGVNRKKVQMYVY
jgi:hypothetical protein